MQFKKADHHDKDIKLRHIFILTPLCLLLIGCSAYRGAIVEDQASLSRINPNPSTSPSTNPSPQPNPQPSTQPSPSVLPSPMTFPSPSPRPGVPAKIIFETGPYLAGLVSQPASEELTIRVIDDTGAPVSGVNVTFEIYQGGGALTGNAMATDALGLCSKNFTYPSSPGQSAVSVVVSGINAAFLITAVSYNPPVASEWSQAIPMPGWRGWAQPVYDTTLKKVIWYGASQKYLMEGSNIYSGGLWAYDSTNHIWQNKWDRRPMKSCEGFDPVLGAGNRHPYRQMAYDSSRGRMWLHNGVCMGMNPTLPNPNQGNPDTLFWDSTSLKWTDKTAVATPATGLDRMVSAMAYDSDRDKVFLFAGAVGASGRADTWELDPDTARWSQITTTGITAASGMTENGLVYDSIHKRLIAFGGWSASSECDSSGCDWIWEFDPSNSNWTMYRPTVRPPSSAHPAFAFDSKRGIAWALSENGSLWAYNAGTHVWKEQTGITNKPTLAAPQSKELAYDVNADKLLVLTNGATFELDMASADLSLP